MALRVFANGALFADATGSGPPRVIALHGWARRGSDFRPALADLDALAPDLPGFGASPPPSEPWGAEGYAHLVNQLLDVCDHPPVVVGHSFGGRIAVCLAALYPERVGSLVLTGAPLVKHTPPRSPSLRYRMIRGLHRVGLLSDDRLERIRRKTGSADYRAASGVMRDVLVRVVNESYESQLRALTAPVSLIWGGADREVPVTVARAVADVIASQGREVDFEILEGVGHLLPVEAPQALRAAIERALVR
ncbi:MAG: alpha/beta hydrolase [Actinomycetota bacterium]|nr:alpha/beta hydrolase [Actinomycetota bacterium]